MNYYDYSYNYGYNTSQNMFSTFMATFASMWLFTMIIIVFTVVCLWKVFKKAGKEGWKSIVPFYNIYVLFEISGISGNKLFFVFIPLVGPFILFYYMIKAYIGLSLNFGKNKTFAIGLIFASPIFLAILALDKNTTYISSNNQNQIYNQQYNQMTENNYNQVYNNVNDSTVSDNNYNQSYDNNIYMNSTPIMSTHTNESIMESSPIEGAPAPVSLNINTSANNDIVENIFNSEIPKQEQVDVVTVAPVNTTEVEEIVVGPNQFYTESEQNTEKIDVFDINNL